MLTRRGFTGFASCAICGLAGFIATDASAQNAQPPAGITRKILSQIDGPIPGYTTISADVTLDAGAKVPRHTHPGIELSVVMEGEFELPIEGQPLRKYKAGDAFQISTRDAACGRQAAGCKMPAIDHVHRGQKQTAHDAGLIGRAAALSATAYAAVGRQGWQ